MTVTELRKELEKLEKIGKGSEEVVLEDDVGFGWCIKDLKEFDNAIFIRMDN